MLTVPETAASARPSTESSFLNNGSSALYMLLPFWATSVRKPPEMSNMLFICLEAEIKHVTPLAENAAVDCVEHDCLPSQEGERRVRSFTFLYAKCKCVMGTAERLSLAPTEAFNYTNLLQELLQVRYNASSTANLKGKSGTLVEI